MNDEQYLPDDDFEEEASSETDLPPGWVWTTLGDIAELVGGGTPSRSNAEYFKGDIVWLTIAEIPKERVAVITTSKERITGQALQKSSARLLPQGSVLLTSRASIGYVAIAGTELATNQAFTNFVCESGLYNYYLAYWLWGNKKLLMNHAIGTTFKEIPRSQLKTLLFPLPPLGEQYRIVKEIERLFSTVQVQVQIIEPNIEKTEQLRQTILQRAFRGKLVMQDPTEEPAQKLLDKIKTERQQRQVKQPPQQDDVSSKRGGKLITQQKRRSLLDVLLEATDKTLPPNELFRLAGFTVETIEEFYNELYKEVWVNQRVEEKRQGNNIFLKVIK